MSRIYRTKEQARLYWRGVLERWHESGQTIGQFCREHQITESGFYSWRKKLALEGFSLEAATAQTKETSFIQIDMHGATQSAMSLKFASGHVLQVTNQVNTEALVKVLRALHEAKLC